MRHLLLILPMLIIGLMITSCTQDLEIEPQAERAAQSNDQFSENANVNAHARKSAAIWADCEAFATVGTNTDFHPDAGNFDELYTGANFMNGMGAVSESKPGDQDYNGGRWHVNTLKEGVDPDKYNDVCSVEGIDPEDFMSTDTYFECPLLPIRGNSGN